jgi:hypothetical protein
VALVVESTADVAAEVAEPLEGSDGQGLGAEADRVAEAAAEAALPSAADGDDGTDGDSPAE